MKYITSIGLLLLVVNAGCSTNSNPPPGSIAALNIPGDSTNLDTVSTSSIPIQEFSGKYIPSADKEVLVDCKNKRLIIKDENKVLRGSYQKNLSTLSYPDESVMTTVMGYLKKSGSGSGQDTLVVTDVKEVKAKSFQTECYDFEFIALGNEPFWSLEIIPDENVIAVKDVAASKSYMFSYSKPRISGNTFLYKITNDKNETLAITIKKENCNDGMSDRNYNYSAAITINGKPLSGCAIKKGDKL